MKILFQGFTGKTGSVVSTYLKSQGHEIVGVDINNPLVDQFYDALIDFSCPKASIKLFEYAIKKKIPCLIGTTGFCNEQREYMKRFANENMLPVMLMGNFLPSISHIQKLIAHISEYFSTITIEETHHVSKVDAPSGTALMLGKMVDDQKKVKYISHRSQDFVYEHKIIFANNEEKVIINHNLYDKIGYAKGVEKALGIITKLKGYHEQF